MEIELVKLSSKGQFTIPLKIRKMLNLKKGDKILITVKNNQIILKHLDEFSQLIEAADSTTDFWMSENDEVWNKI